MNSVYLDNSATSFPKPEPVYQAVTDAMRHAGANPGRGGHRMSLDAARLVHETREAVAGYFGIDDSSRLVFTSGATEAINLALFGLLSPGDRVVTTSMEHNAVARPLRVLQDRGVEVARAEAGTDGLVEPEQIIRHCTTGTRLVAMTHCSNVTGTLQPIAEIGAACRERGILLLVDAAQSAGLFPIDVARDHIDLLAFPGHKGLYGPPGTGGLYVRDGIDLEPLVYGGTGANSDSDRQPAHLPERFESGTLNVPGLAGLRAGIAFVREVGSTAIREHERQLVGALLDGLARLDPVQLFGPLDADLHGGAVSFTISGRDPAEIGFALDHKYGIMVRVGLHCAPDAHRTIGSYPAGTVRVSPGYFNTRDEIDHFLQAVRELAA